MEHKFSYTPQGVCCRKMEISVDGDTITGVTFYGGCNGNLKGVAALVKGAKVSDVIARLSGIDCGGRGASCPDQLAKALSQLAK
ncbi:MAG: TIGR03905 family TSCPD domain-containing protein [Rikenellaceae bacterium]